MERLTREQVSMVVDTARNREDTARIFKSAVTSCICGDIPWQQFEAQTDHPYGVNLPFLRGMVEGAAPDPEARVMLSEFSEQQFMKTRGLLDRTRAKLEQEGYVVAW